VISGDIVYAGVFPWTAETTPEQRKVWMTTIDAIAALNPKIVVAGHQARWARASRSTVRRADEALRPHRT